LYFKDDTLLTIKKKEALLEWHMSKMKFPFLKITHYISKGVLLGWRISKMKL
jgi:hypothetical protein